MEIIGGKADRIPQVTVLCITYNQKKYIKHALESMLMQKTSFEYEIVVHDDASTDGTAEIVREFANKYPDKIIAILQNENRYGKVKISTFTEPYVKGEYVAFCEGDDYWTSELKLQMQYDVMQNHLECSMCVHKVQGISEDGSKRIRQFPRFEIDKEIIDADRVMHWMLADYEWVFHTSSYFIRSEIWRKSQLDGPMYVQKSVYGDEAYMRYCAANGEFYYISESMSCYRMNAIGSTINASRGKVYNADLYKRRIEVLGYFDSETNERFHEDVLQAIEIEKIGLLRARKEYRTLLKNKSLYNKLSSPAKLQVFISAYFPIFDKIYFKLRKLMIKY